MTEFFDDAPGGRRGGSGLTLLVLDRAAIAALNLPGGQTWNWAFGLARDVERSAKELLIAAGGVGPEATLLRSIGSSVVPVGLGVQVNVRATALHALWYIKGTFPHHEPLEQNRRIITYEGEPPSFTGKHAGDEDFGFMKFFWFKAGKLVYRQDVEHPGYVGNNFLNEAKLDVLVQRGII